MEKQYFNDTAVWLNVYILKIIKIPSEIKDEFIYIENKEFWCNFIFIDKKVSFNYVGLDEIEIEFLYD
jgi:hypothetical protein